MLDFLNKMFESKGLEFTRIIVTHIKLPEDIAKPLDYKAQYGSMNDYERTRHAYDMRLLNDEQELELIKQMKGEQRQQTN
jgi:delta 1-pyrroline-5-carboxylate dehydrogenase